MSFCGAVCPPLLVPPWANALLPFFSRSVHVCVRGALFAVGHKNSTKRVGWLLRAVTGYRTPCAGLHVLHGYRCDCNSPVRADPSKRLGHWIETRSKKRDPKKLSDKVIAQIDEHTTVDAQLFAAALRLLLGRLRRVEEMSGKELLRCIDWHRLHTTTHYIAGLWDGPDSLLLTGKE